MSPVQNGWELEQAQVRLELLDAAITSYRIAGDQEVVARLMSIREIAAAKADRMASGAAPDAPSA